MLIKNYIKRTRIINSIHYPKFCTNSLFNKKYIISGMEKNVKGSSLSGKEEAEFNQLLKDMNIEQKNMPDVPKRQPRITRYIYILNI